MTSNACPQNIWNHTDGCVCAPNGTITAEATDVDLTPAPAQARTVEELATDVNDLWVDWHPEHNPEVVGTALSLARQIRDASEEDRPGYDMLVMRIDLLADRPNDSDLAEDALFEMRQITRKSNMSVVEDGQGGHTRLADGRPGVTCPDCGNGFATGAVLEVHQDRDCTGLDVTRDYTLDRDGYDHDNGTDDDEDGLDHDALHSVAESYASDVNNAGRGAQVAFLRAHGWTTENLTEEIGKHDDWDGALDDQVIDHASQAASQVYNNGLMPGSSQGGAEIDVIGALDAKHFKTDKEFEDWLVDPASSGRPLTWESPDDDDLAWFINGTAER